MDIHPRNIFFIRFFILLLILLYMLKTPAIGKVKVGINFDSYTTKYSLYKEVYEGFSTGTNIIVGNKLQTLDVGIYYTESYYVYTKYTRWDITSVYSRYYKYLNIFSGIHYISSDYIYSHGTVVIFAGTEYFLKSGDIMVGLDTSLSIYRNIYFSLYVNQLSKKFKWRIRTFLIPALFLETAVYYINPFENFEFIPKRDFLSAEVFLSAGFTKVLLGVGFMIGEQILAVKHKGFGVNTSFATNKKDYSLYAKYYVLPSFTINARISKTFAEYLGVDYYYESYSVGINAMY